MSSCCGFMKPCCEVLKVRSLAEVQARSKQHDLKHLGPFRRCSDYPHQPPSELSGHEFSSGGVVASRHGVGAGSDCRDPHLSICCPFRRMANCQGLSRLPTGSSTLLKAHSLTANQSVKRLHWHSLRWWRVGRLQTSKVKAS